jgi:hypothetical protein
MIRSYLNVLVYMRIRSNPVYLPPVISSKFLKFYQKVNYNNSRLIFITYYSK